MKSVTPGTAASQLLGDIRQLIEQSRGQLAVAVNSALTMLYWQIGYRIRTEMLGNERAAYGEQIVSAVSRQLEADFGRGFSAKNLRHMMRFAEAKAEYKGQMELYLRWLAKHEQEHGEAPPLGIILCSGKKQEQIELLELDSSGSHVAEYLTSLPPKEVLQAKLHQAIASSRARLENRGEDAAVSLTA